MKKHSERGLEGDFTLEKTAGSGSWSYWKGQSQKKGMVKEHAARRKESAESTSLRGGKIGRRET